MTFNSPSNADLLWRDETGSGQQVQNSGTWFGEQVGADHEVQDGL